MRAYEDLLPGLGVPICASSASLIELTYLPAFVRPSRSENVSLLLNAPMRRFLRRAFDGRCWREDSAIIAR
jgi:hypothetical protein